MNTLSFDTLLKLWFPCELNSHVRNTRQLLFFQRKITTRHFLSYKKITLYNLFFLIYFFIGVVWVALAHKKPKLILDNNSFTVNKQMNNRTLWRCTNYFKSKCRATLVTYGKIVKINNQFHNHLPNEMCTDNMFTQHVTIIR